MRGGLGCDAVVLFWREAVCGICEGGRVDGFFGLDGWEWGVWLGRGMDGERLAEALV
jgi:hypothetical protein